MRIHNHAITLSLVSLLAACAGSAEKKKEDSSKDGAANSQVGNNSDPGVNNVVTNSNGDVIQNNYTGYDGGKTNFALIFPGYRVYTAMDDLVKIEKVTSKLSDETINQLIAERKKSDSTFDEARFRKRFSREQTSYKITPLKPGVAKIKVERPNSGGPGGPPGGGGGNHPQNTGGNSNNNDCKFNSHPGGGGTFSGAFDRQRGVNMINLTIAQYDANAVESGRQRYNTEGTGFLRACASCHLSHKEGAPSHQLGRIMDISDQQAMSWVTEGKLGSRTAGVTHTWSFSSPDQEHGIVPYLRSVATSDPSELTKLYVEQSILEEQACEAEKSGTSTGTNSSVSP